MTWFCVYAIVRATASLPSDHRGIHDEPLSIVGVHEVAAVVGERSDREIAMNTKLVLAHHQLVSAISEAMTALPVRFGTVVQSRDQLQNALRERHDVLRDDLERLAG